MKHDITKSNIDILIATIDATKFEKDILEFYYGLSKKQRAILILCQQIVTDFRASTFVSKSL